MGNNVSNFFTPEFNNESAIGPWNASLEAAQGIIRKLDPNSSLTGGVGQEVNIPTLTPESYDNIILPDALPTSIASALTTDSNTSLPDSSVDLLTGQAMSEVYEDLSKFAAGSDFASKMNLAFGENWDAAGAKALAEGWFNGDFSAIPSVKVVSSAEIGGANGAFAAATDTIYLSKEFLTQNEANPAAVADVLLEEIGHSVDSLLNVTDSPGDEGAIFAAVVQGKELSQGEIQGLKSEDDRATTTIDGKVIEIEEQQLSGGSQGTILGVDGSGILLGGELTRNDSNNPTRPGKFADEYRLEGASEGQQLQLDLNSEDFDTFLQLVDERTGRVIDQDDDDGDGRNSRLSFTVQPNINYLVRATSYDPGETGSYNISSTRLSPGLSTDGAGNDFSNARQISVGHEQSSYNDFVGDTDGNDYYKFTLNQKSNFNLSLNGLSDDADVRLFLDRNDNRVIDNGETVARSIKSGTLAETISMNLEEPGTYYIQVYPGTFNVNTNYNLNVAADLNWGTITGPNVFGETISNPIGIERVDNNGRGSSQPIESGRETWLVIHGWKGNPSEGEFPGLAKAIDGSEDQVLTLDWSGAASSTGLFGADVAKAASWITTVADWAAQKLIELGFTNNEGRSTNNLRLNLVGHSLGTYVAAEIAKRIPGGVDRIVALDPAKEFQGGYDTSTIDFSANSQFSWGFYGSAAGSVERAVTADESWSMGFGGVPLWSASDNHGRVINFFSSMVEQAKNDPNHPISKYFDLSQMSQEVSKPWRNNTLNDFGGNLTGVLLFEGRLEGKEEEERWIPRELVYYDLVTGNLQEKTV
ncbi:MAG: alpha/beta fold hydrolase [Oscillatoriaceae cyanobacterium Prado104]|jgi:pimeloyl-ACP methyl ester carboxylesterase|nr:alpha/beta fold hydrolase [Oscillatoriaceae cyanobacterium Prado104]